MLRPQRRIPFSGLRVLEAGGLCVSAGVLPVVGLYAGVVAMSDGWASTDVRVKPEHDGGEVAEYADAEVAEHDGGAEIETHDGVAAERNGGAAVEPASGPVTTNLRRFRP